MVSWILAVLLPILAAAAAWPWMGITTSARNCATGGGGNYLGVAGLAILRLAAPIIIGWRSRRATGSVAQAVSPIVVSILLGLPLIFLAAQAWWSSNNCYT